MLKSKKTVGPTHRSADAERLSVETLFFTLNVAERAIVSFKVEMVAGEKYIYKNAAYNFERNKNVWESGFNLTRVLDGLCDIIESENLCTQM